MVLASIIALVMAPQVTQVEAVLQEQIGSSDGQVPEEVFGRLADLAADAEGNVYVLENQAAEVRVFSSSGEHLRTFGRRGPGPAELNRPMNVDVRGDAVTVLNPGGQTSSFTLVGRELQPQRMPFGAQSTIRINELSYAVLTSGGISREDPIPIESLVMLSPTGTDTVLAVPSSDILFRGPTSSAALSTALCRLAYFVVGSDGELWVTSGAEGTLTEWRFVNGVAEPGRSVGLAPEGVPLPDSTRARILRLVPRQLSPETGDLSLPPILSSMCGIERSSDRTVWVRLRDVEGRERWIAVELETLRPTLELTAPEGVEMRAFSGEMGYGIWSDPSGIPYVMVYRFE